MITSCPLLNASQHQNDPNVPLEPCRRNPPCEPPPNPCWLAQRVSKLISQLSEPSNVTQSVTALNSFLAIENLNVCDVANLLLKQKSYSDEDMKFAFEKGKEVVGREVGQQQQNAALKFFDGDQPRWYEIAVYCQENFGRLQKPSAFEIDFTSKIVGRMLDREPTYKEAPCLLRLFVKLGGRCDPRIKANYF